MEYFLSFIIHAKLTSFWYFLISVDSNSGEKKAGSLSIHHDNECVRVRL